MESCLTVLSGDAVAIREFISLWQWRSLISQKHRMSSIFHCKLNVWKVIMCILAECMYLGGSRERDWCWFSYLWSFAIVSRRSVKNPCAQAFPSIWHERREGNHHNFTHFRSPLLKANHSLISIVLASCDMDFSSPLLTHKKTLTTTQ